MTAAQISNAIQDAEGVVEAVMRTQQFRTTFDAAKHMIIRAVTTSLAAYYCIIFDPSSFQLRDKLALQVDMLWNDVQRGLAILLDQKTVTYLASL